MLKHKDGSFGDISNALTEQIIKEFEKWSFSESEKIIALELLLGRSIKHISEKRNVAESTIRNQCHFIYSKSGLSGKYEFASYFLQKFLQGRK